MAPFVKFDSLTEAIAEKAHNLGSDQLVIALTNTQPAAANTQLSDITQITYTNLSSRNVTTTTSAQSGGVYKLVLADLVLTATGAVGPFRYAVLYNSTAVNSLLIAYWDYGSSVTLANGETFTVDFDPALGVLTIT